MQPTIGLSWMLSDGGDREGAEGVEGVYSPMERSTVSTANPPLPGAPRDWTTNQRIHMALATYVAEDGLVGHHWEEMALGLRVFNAPM